LGWKAAWLSEIEPFPSAVLAHHYPDVPNLGDMTTLPERILSGEVEAPDVFCGGTPCQAFSVAGLRNSLDDARGNLSLTFVGIANAIDHVRSVRSDAPAIIFWENVPGVLSTKDNAFGCFLAGIAGEDNPLEPPRGKWTNSGYVLGPKRAVAWRLLDAQYFGVAQRRKRVFVVASAREDFDPAAVLFEFDSVRRDTAPSREEGKKSAASLVPSVAGSLDTECGGGKLTHQSVANGHLIGTITARMFNALGTRDVEAGAIMPVVSPALNTCSGSHHAPDTKAYVVEPITYGIRTANTSSNGWGIQEEVTHTLDCAQGVAVAQPMVLVDQGGSVMNVEHNMVGTLRRETHGHEPVVMQPVCLGGQHPNAGIGIDQSPTLTNAMGAGGGHVPIGIFQDSEYGVQQYDSAGTLRAGRIPEHQMAIQPPSMAVRRLTPVECERLQGFPDNYTNIPWRKKDESPDGPRYKALGNSWAVPNVRWIGQRIQENLK
jgi:DNA (cytosine-5)-methyltransferase 1